MNLRVVVVLFFGDMPFRSVTSYGGQITRRGAVWAYVALGSASCSGVCVGWVCTVLPSRLTRACPANDAAPYGCPYSPHLLSPRCGPVSRGEKSLFFCCHHGMHTLFMACNHSNARLMWRLLGRNDAEEEKSLPLFSPNEGGRRSASKFRLFLRLGGQPRAALQ